MEKQTVQYDLLEKIFNSLRKKYGDNEHPEDVVLGKEKEKYSTVLLWYPVLKSKEFFCFVAFRNKPDNQGQILSFWLKTPIKNKIKKPNYPPIIKIETYWDKSENIFRGTLINYFTEKVEGLWLMIPAVKVILQMILKVRGYQIGREFSLICKIHKIENS